MRNSVTTEDEGRGRILSQTVEQSMWEMFIDNNINLDQETQLLPYDLSR